MTPKHLVFIVNPRSGVERRKEIETSVAAGLPTELYTYEILTTEYARHGTELARAAAAAGAWAVVAVGGDGSVNDIVHGLHGTSTMLGIIPKGSGNGVARAMGIPLDTAGAVQVLASGNSKKIDVGTANGKLFVSNVGVAFDALISRKFAKSTKRGFAVYSWLVTKYLWRYQPWQFGLTVDGISTEKDAFMLTIANNTQFGYNFKIAPMAQPDDGLLDIVVLRPFPKLLGGWISYLAMTGNINKSKYVQHYRGKHISIHHPQLRLMQTDGDAHQCDSTVHISVLPQAIEILVP